MLVSEKELSELPDDSSNIFKKSNIDRYIEDLMQHFVMESTVL